jgi:beta-galactosidase GanA
MRTIWPKLAALHLNTVLVPVYWDLIEPRAGVFDFSLVDGVLRDARQAHMRLVLLWFGSWKNSMSSYVPAWVKTNQARFPRAERRNRVRCCRRSALPIATPTHARSPR